MIELIQNGLMFGNLVLVDSPVLVDRYNRALKHLTGLETGLDEFHIDISGFSPEVGDELNNRDYLNPEGVNRQFIILSTEQKSCPLLNARFSTARQILHEFFTRNENQLFALTARDAVTGELIDNLHTISDLSQLLHLGSTTVEADTTGGAVKTAAKLRDRIETFKSEPDAWWDDVLIAEMIELSAQAGDVIRNPVTFDAMEFSAQDFWTQHFGGVYVFRSPRSPAMICRTAVDVRDERANVMSFADRNSIAKFLQRNRLVENLVDARGGPTTQILREKMDFILIDVAARAGEPLRGVSPRDLRTLARKYIANLPAEWHGLGDLLRWAEGRAPWPRIDSDHPAYFYTLRAMPGPQADMVNMLLAELSPLDIRQLFVCHKQAFYAAYADWPQAKKDFTVEMLMRDYQADKAGLRTRLFGGGTTTEFPRTKRRRSADDLVERVGPWGAVNRSRR
jgi:hypothetical protein